MQFQQGKWVRYIDELCPAVTGRSSFLNEAGEREQIMGCGLDPAYRLSMDDWISLMAMTQYYEWMGNGVLATLTIRFSNDIRGITYDVGLEFEDFSAKKRRENALALYHLSNGGATLEKITAQRAQDLRDVKLRIKALEENAVRRGDSMVSR